MAILFTGDLVPATTLAIAAGSTWQQVFARNPNRQALQVENYATTTSQNIGTVESLFVFYQQNVSPTNPPQVAAPTGNPWSIGAIELTAGGTLSLTSGVCTEQPIFVWAATISHAFAAWENK